MFGGCFALKDKYRKIRGSGLLVSMEAACIGGIAGFAVLTAVNGFIIEITPFTLLIAFVKALNGILFSFCSFKALDCINLSLFSLYSMLGGMLLPFLQGIIFFDETFTFGKAVCVAFVFSALLCTVKKGDKKGGVIFYVGIFVLNGMSGVISKIYTSSDFPKASAAGYSALGSMMTVLLSGMLWLCLWRRAGRGHGECSHSRLLYVKSSAIVSVSGAVNTVANFLLVLALLHVDASVQYPMVTGGTMIVSTAISYFGDKKPKTREIISVSLAFVGMLALFIIPI